MRGSARAGYALVVVLFSLTVLTLIFGTASTRTLAHLQQTQTGRVMAERFEGNVATAELVMVLGPDALSETAQLQQVTMQPVTGLVDLNTAAPALLRLLLAGYGLPEAEIRGALERYRSWRREGRKLLRISDFFRVTGLEAAALPGVEGFVTVYSGRTGIAAEQAPLDLLQHLTGEDGGREALVALLDPALLGPGSAVNQLLVQEGRLLGMLHLGGGANGARVLELR